MTGKVAIAAVLPELVQQRLQEQLDVVFLPELVGDPERLAEQIDGDGFTAILISLPAQITADVIQRLPKSVKVIATYSVGLDHIDVAAAKARGLVVLNTPDVLTDAVADTALLLMLGAARRVTESIALIREQRWQGWQPTQLLGTSLADKTLGVMGMGRIGQAIADRARAFGMTIHYHNRSQLPAEREQGAQYYADKAAFLSQLDVLVLACGLTVQTRGWLNQQTIAAMRDSAMVVNIGRGDLIDDEALISALRSGRLRAAGLDVFSNEPDINPAYYELPNVFMLPHIGSSTIETRLQMAQILIDGLQQVANGQRPVNQV